MIYTNMPSYPSHKHRHTWTSWHHGLDRSIRYDFFFFLGMTFYFLTSNLWTGVYLPTSHKNLEPRQRIVVSANPPTQSIRTRRARTWLIQKTSRHMVRPRLKCKVLEEWDKPEFFIYRSKLLVERAFWSISHSSS